MKLSFISILLLFICINGFSQTNATQDTSTTINNNNKNSSQHFNLDGDDIYSGRNEADSILISEYEYQDTYNEEESFAKKEHKRHVMRVFLNVSLLILWVFSHY